MTFAGIAPGVAGRAGLPWVDAGVELHPASDAPTISVIARCGHGCFTERIVTPSRDADLGFPACAAVGHCPGDLGHPDQMPPAPLNSGPTMKASPHNLGYPVLMGVAI